MRSLKYHPLFPPQLFQRFAALSKLTFDARKANSNQKAQIRIGEEDLLLLVKAKGDNEWFQE